MSFRPSAACCKIPPIVSKGYYKKGEYLIVGGLKNYVTRLASAKNSILVVYDIFGFADQILQDADILAFRDTENDPYRVSVLDYFESKSADISWNPPTTKEHGKALGNLFGGIQNPGRTILRIPGIVKAMRKNQKSIESVFSLGLCWGVNMLNSKPQVITASSGEDSPFKAVALAHPAMINPKEVKEIAVPILLLPSKDEKAKDIQAFFANSTAPNRV